MLELIIILAMIFAISTASLNKPVILFQSTSIESLIKQSRNFISFADLKAIFRNFLQSFFELPAFLSIKLAPIEVKLLISWPNKELYILSYFYSFTKRIIPLIK